jgi:hypothetical protein
MTQHVSEEALILHYYGESEAGAGTSVEHHLSDCCDCRLRYQQLQRILNSVEYAVPERGANYEEELWSRVAPRLAVRRRMSWWTWRQWIGAGAMALLILAAFLAGRYSPRTEEEPVIVQELLPPVRERVLGVAVGDHLERSQMVLVELANAGESEKLNITGERELAQNLIDSNRLFRQTASLAGETGVVTLLEDLERVLLEIAHSPEELSGEQLEQLRQRIETQGLIFKIRVMGLRIRERVEKPLPDSGQTRL